MPVPTFSAHFIAHSGLRRAVAQYLVHEREAIAGQIKELSQHAPFRKGG
jgi:predicted N-acyltransferase